MVLIRTLLEGACGLLLIISGGLISVGRERTGYFNRHPDPGGLDYDHQSAGLLF